MQEKEISSLSSIQKISYFYVFFRKRSSSILWPKRKPYFRRKEIASFLIIQKMSYYSAVSFETTYFQSIWGKKNMIFGAFLERLITAEKIRELEIKYLVLLV